MQIMVNKKNISFATNANLNNVLQELNLVNKKIALALNDKIISKSKFSSTVLNEGDKIDIIQAVGGG